METVVIGIDGGEWDVINPLISEGYLPNIKRLKESGVAGPLHSIKPPVSPPAWTSIQTGTNPGKHGVFDFSTFDENYNRRSINAADRAVTPFWTVMNNNSISTGLFKTPFTYPPSDLDGFVVTGFPTPKTVRDYAKPPSIVNRIGSPDNLFEDGSFLTRGDYEGYKQNLLDVAERQTEVLHTELDYHNPDFLMAVYDGSDRIQHFFWKYMDEGHPNFEADPVLSTAIRDYYQVIDRGIGEILERADEKCNVLLISDHGFGPLVHDIYIDEWLEEKGYLLRKEQTTNITTKNIIRKTIQSTWEAICKAGLDTVVREVTPSYLLESWREIQIDSKDEMIGEETKAFFTTLSGQAMFINRADRFENGIVTEEEYESVVSNLESDLMDLRNPQTGESLIEAVYRTDEIFEGSMVESAPDLIINSAPEYTLKDGRSNSLVKSATQYSTERSGDHREEGIIIATGPDFESGNLRGGSVLDIAPTLLYLHDCPIPQIYDGEILEEILSSDLLQRRDIERTTEYSNDTRENREWTNEEEDEMEERLRELGYLG